MFHLVEHQPRREPYSDWFARIVRIVERRIGGTAYVFDSAYLHSCYDVGLTPQEIADDLME
jgi:hypothetical protein